MRQPPVRACSRSWWTRLRSGNSWHSAASTARSRVALTSTTSVTLAGGRPKYHSSNTPWTSSPSARCSGWCLSNWAHHRASATAAATTQWSWLSSPTPECGSCVTRVWGRCVRIARMTRSRSATSLASPSVSVAQPQSSTSPTPSVVMARRNSAAERSMVVASSTPTESQRSSVTRQTTTRHPWSAKQASVPPQNSVGSSACAATTSTTRPPPGSMTVGEVGRVTGPPTAAGPRAQRRRAGHPSAPPRTTPRTASRGRGSRRGR